MDTGAGLSLYPLRLTLTAKEPLALDEHPGSALRGAVFNALLRRFCANPTASSCAACPLNATCPVAGLVAPLRDENPRGRDVPRPFVLAAEGDPAPDNTPGLQRFAPGDTLRFRITLIGRAIAFFPYLALATQLMEHNGIGRPLRENGGRRGRFEINRIELVNPFSDETQLLYQRGQTKVSSPTLPTTVAHVTQRARALPADALTLRFLTPTRLVDRGQLVRHPSLRVICARLAERLDALTREYASASAPPADPGDPESALASQAAQEMRDRAQRLAEHAARITVVENATRWVDVASYSARQQRSTPIGGLVGHATYVGDLAPLRELLVWGELLHVGKNAVKGDGRYHIEHPAPRLL
ncbi:MAG TPA: CRISPR system precrRNA processing endoribonuclease RAMP protein Cas6 [Ktedonobacterales bacterium]|nr:CRISPR system precrRNA processing endoribonuclease RAMP protein Cas6 [Ktedonobacterales bacterium]